MEKMSVTYDVVRFAELDQTKCDELIRARKSFEVVNVPAFRQKDAVAIVENRIEALGLTCRVYQKGRFGLGLHPLGLLGLAAHNLATFDPDYEIRKEFSTGIVVTYKK